MPYVFVPQNAKRKLDHLRLYMSEHEYRRSTISGYSTYVSRFLRSNFYAEGSDTLKSQVDKFLKNEIAIHPKTFADSRIVNVVVLFAEFSINSLIFSYPIYSINFFLLRRNTFSNQFPLHSRVNPRCLGQDDMLHLKAESSPLLSKH